MTPRTCPNCDGTGLHSFEVSPGHPSGNRGTEDCDCGGQGYAPDDWHKAEEYAHLIVSAIDDRKASFALEFVEILKAMLEAPRRAG
jgi:hypothetical protein